MKTKRGKNLTVIFFFAVLAISALFFACIQPMDTPSDKPSENTPTPSPTPSLTPSPITKFEAVSYTGNDKIKYSFTYNDYNIYYIYLGELKNIPLFYDDTHRHSWTYTSTTYTFSITNATTATISNTITRTSQEAVSVAEEYTVSKTTGGKVGAEIGTSFVVSNLPIDVKLNGEYYWSDYTSNASSTGFQLTTSLTNTVEHGTSQTQSTMRETSFTLTRNDREGFYRYTYFSTSDIYLYVVKNSKTNEIYYEFREYVIPGAYSWGLDYSETSSFRKSDLTAFELDLSILENLPKPELDFLSYTVIYNANGGSGTMRPDVHVYGIEQNLLKNSFTPPAGYSFAGWARSPNAVNAEFPDEKSVLNLANEKGATVSLYAVWSLIDVIMERTIARNGSLNIAIPANITKAIISGENGVTYNNAEIIVAERTLPLTIELHNINAVGRHGANGSTGSNGGAGRPVIYMGNYTCVPNLTIVSSGVQNRLDGGKGGNGGEGKSNGTGGKGGNGGATILANKITIMGNANIILRGGDGGSGGRGGDTGVTFNATNGGGGGNGGASIDANIIANNLVGIVFALRSVGGSGGELYRGLTGLAFIGGSNGTTGNRGVQFTSTPSPIGTVRDQL